jgi:hypothetical protein
MPQTQGGLVIEHIPILLVKLVTLFPLSLSKWDELSCSSNVINVRS